ncbi:Listeria/Bacterioides repeat-containing protein [Flavobacterium glycines]|uniref:Listeria/Bacterioides repeat-containing protein n=2 Tax=Flavobacterium glycines TaxID=551990 RepID=A0A1G8SKL8_9FLAO|nr:pectinesterase family protein [Flavobacterium glycines]SDJ29160.1 Listeria/Bacterioides repeat-containing protein [Flavobacterium glycines]
MKRKYFISLLLILFSVMGFSQTVQRIEAETFNQASGARAETNATLSGTGNVGYIKNNTWIKFTGHVFNQYDSRFDVKAAGATGGTIEFRLDAVDGTLIGTATVSGSTSFSDYKIFSTSITSTTGTHDLYLVFKHPTSTGYLFNVDYFEKVTSDPNAVLYTLTTSVSPTAGGSITANPGGTQINQGTAVTLTANKNFGYKFTRWKDANGTTISTANPYTFTMTANTTLVAEYETLETFTLTVNKAGAYGLGDYTISPAGKDGAFAVYEKGTDVTITAVENDVIKFSNWDDGSTTTSKVVTMNNNSTVTANYANVPFIAGWTFKDDQYAHPRVAELYSKVENRPQLFGYHVSDNTLAANVRLQNRGGKNGFSVWNSDRGQFFYFMTTLSTVGYKNINVSSGLIGYYYGADQWTFQYSLDGTNFVNVSSLTTINTNSITSIGGVLPAEAEGKEKIYLRWFPNVNGPTHGSAVDVTATVISNIIVKADEVLVVDTTAPVLQSSIPVEGATTASASGTIILNYDESVQLGTGQATLNGKNLTAEFVNKTVKFSYFGLEYNKQYTFSLPAGFVKDLSANNAAAVNLSFTTMQKPIPAKRNFDLIVDANATDDQVASGKYVKTIAEAFTKAPSNSATRYLVFITNGTYNLGGDGTNPQSVLLTLPSGKNNVSLIAQSKDKVILQGNPGWGIKNAVLAIEANDLYMENVTIEHKDGITTSGQRPAINPAGDRNVYNGVRLRSKQDTEVTGGNRTFYYNSTIEGDVDFICGGGTHWYEQCNLVSVAAGYLVAPNHDANTKYGYIFNNCTISAATSYYLGRPWQNSPRAVYLNTKMLVEPNTAGWASMGTVPAIFAEYNSVNGSGVKVNTDNRTNVFTVNGVPTTGNYNPVLTKEQADVYTIENVLSGTDKWNPLEIVEQIAAPVNLVIGQNNTLTWNANQYAICYVVCRDGKFLAITTDATYTDTETLTGSHEYTVQAANAYGGLSALSKVTVGGPVTSTITYMNSVGNVAIANLSPVSYTEGVAVTLPTPAMQGYTFYGWSTSATVPNTIKEIATTTKGAQTFYAFWGVGGNNQADPVTPPTNFDYVYTATTSKSWDVATNFNPAVFPEAGKQVSVTKEIETTPTIFLGDITFSGSGTLRLRGSHKATGKLIFKEGTRVYYYSGTTGMSLEAPIVTSGNVKFEMMSSAPDQTTMTLMGPVSGNGNVICLNTGQGTIPNTGVLFLKGDNSEFNGTWDLTKKNTSNPALDYISVIEGSSVNAFGSGTINIDKGNYVIFSNERAAGANLKLNIINGKAVLNTILNVQKLTLNGVDYTSGSFDKTTNPEYFAGDGKIEITSAYTGGVVGTIPAFPGAEGYGKYVTGGRGGKVIYVTNLNDSGAGSLRAAINTSGPKIILFKVSGNIKLLSELSIYDNTTIAGQQAPGGGICLQDYNVKIRGNNIIVRYMRFRMGDTHAVENDAFGGRFQENIMIDHCSVSWSTDEAASFYENKNFTMQWCVISESLRNSVHFKGAHGYGGIWGGLKASFHHNLLAHHDSRNPRLGEYAGRTVPLEGLLDVRNNVIYNWGLNSCYGGDAMNVNLVNNYWKPGPGTSSSTTERILSTGRSLDPTSPLYGIWGKFYVDGNYVVGSQRATQDNWTYGVYNQFHGSQLPVSDADKAAMRTDTPHAPGEVTTHSATKAYELVLNYVGASLYRDEVDQRAVNDTRNGNATIMNGGNGSTNGYIDTPSAAGGWPVLPTAPAPVDTDGDGMPDSWETEKGLNPNSAVDGNLTTLDGKYTNLEVYLNGIVKTITDNQNGSLDVYVNPTDFVEKYNKAEDGSKFIMAAGTYTSTTPLVITNNKYRFVPDGSAKPILATTFYTDNATITKAGFSFDGVAIDLTNANSNFLQFKNGASLSSFEIKNATIKGIKQSLLVTEGNSENVIDAVTIDNCIIDGLAVNGYNFIQPDAHLVKAITVKNSTIYNFDKALNFIVLQNSTNTAQAINVQVESNTIYNVGSMDTNALVYVNNPYASASVYNFKNNVMQQKLDSPKATYMFYSNHASGAGTATLDNNLVDGVTSVLVKGTLTKSETNVKTVSGLGLTALVFPNPALGDFSFSKNSPLATASSTAGAIGDPRWLKTTATFSPITYLNSIDGQPITGLVPVEYRQGGVTLLPTPVLDGYIFFGWSNSPTVPGVIKSIAATATGTQTLYAFWGDGGNNRPINAAPTTYTVSYLNMPKLAINSNLKTIEIGTTYKLLDPQCRGYRFMGWFTDAEHMFEITGFDATQTTNVSVYARWKKLQEFYAFPTVTKNSVTLKSSVEKDNVSIVSMTGAVLKQINTSQYETEISVGDLPSGYYLIQSATTGMSTKFIIK